MKKVILTGLVSVALSATLAEAKFFVLLTYLNFIKVPMTQLEVTQKVIVTLSATMETLMLLMGSC